MRLVWSRGFVTDDGDKVSAIDHSLAAEIAFVMVFVGSSALFSKIKRFLAVQMDHDIHGKRLVEVPTSGRFMRCRDVFNTIFCYFSIIYYTNLNKEGRTNN